MLGELGVPLAENTILSDRALDLRLDHLAGKRVALIDDAIILGTSLARARQKIEKSVDAKISIHAFCVDKDNYCKELVVPDTVSLWLPENEVMAFSTAEVRALSLLPRPYIVDFPLALLILPRPKGHGFLAQRSWRGVRISTHLQAKNNVTVISFFPTAEATEYFTTVLGPEWFSAIDLLKVRVFARVTGTRLHVKVVPIVTLHPLKWAQLDRIFDGLLQRFETVGCDLSQLRHHCILIESKQRVIQYILSLVVGEYFADGVADNLPEEPRMYFSPQACLQNFGPWLEKDILFLHHKVTQAFGKHVQPSKAKALTRIRMSPVVANWAKEFLPKKPRFTPPWRRKEEQIPSNLLADLTGVFLLMYEKRELPARAEVKRVGILTGTRDWDRGEC